MRCRQGRRGAGVGLPDDQVALPAAWLGSVLDSGAPFADRPIIAQRAPLLGMTATRLAAAALPRQVSPRVVAEPAAAVHGPIDRLRAHPPPRHHRPRRTTHNPQQPIALITTDLPNTNTLSPTPTTPQPTRQHADAPPQTLPDTALETSEAAWVRVEPTTIAVGDRVRSVTPGHLPHWQSEGVVTEIVEDGMSARGWLTLRDDKGYDRHFWLRSTSEWWMLR